MSCNERIPVSEAQKKLSHKLRWQTCKLLLEDPNVYAVPRCVNPNGEEVCVVNSYYAKTGKATLEDVLAAINETFKKDPPLINNGNSAK